MPGPLGYPNRLLICGAAIAVLSVAAAIGSWSANSQYLRAEGDPYRVAAQLNRFEPLAPLIPAQATLGYLSDLPQTRINGQVAFLTAQYALAPRLLVDAGGPRKPQVVVGNFSGPQDYTAAGKQFGLELVRDLGQGVVLYRRAGK